MAIIHIPTPLRKFTGQNRSFKTDKSTLNGAIEDLIDTYPEVKSNLLDESGNVRSYVKIYIGDDEVKPFQNGDIQLKDETEVSIVPAIAGGIPPLKSLSRTLGRERINKVDSGG